jgi:hypothetical protein
MPNIEMPKIKIGQVADPRAEATKAGSKTPKIGGGMLNFTQHAPK